MKLKTSLSIYKADYYALRHFKNIDIYNLSVYFGDLWYFFIGARYIKHTVMAGSPVIMREDYLTCKN